jgi:hypothetical protein
MTTIDLRAGDGETRFSIELPRPSVKDHQLRAVVGHVNQHNLRQFGETEIFSVEMHRAWRLEECLKPVEAVWKP